MQGTCGFYFNSKAQKSEQYNVTYIENEETELNQLLAVYQQGQKQALLLNSELAAQLFKKSRGKTVELTQERFEQFWHGDDNNRGFVDDPYISYFWQQCPEVIKYTPQLRSVYESLYQNVSQTSSNKAKGESA